MKGTQLRWLVMLVLVAQSVPSANGMRIDRGSRELRRQRIQLEAYERKLNARFDPDTWFVFEVIRYKPNAGIQLDLKRRGNRIVRNQQLNFRMQLVPLYFKIRGTRSAAATIFQLSHSRLVVRYNYRAFDDKETAAEFVEAMRS